jgi:hypothetical protein
MQPLEMPNKWIFPLVRSAQIQLLTRTENIELMADNQFFLGLSAQIYKAPLSTFPMESRVVSHVEAAVALWLQFRPRPGMSLSTSRAVSTFTLIARKAFGNTNFLYLSHIQNGIKQLRSNLTEERTSLTDIPWEKMAEELKDHPLAYPSSNETLALDHLTGLLWTISSFSCPPQFFDMSSVYESAVRVGGKKGVKIFTDSMPQPSLLW